MKLAIWRFSRCWNAILAGCLKTFYHFAMEISHHLTSFSIIFHHFPYDLCFHPLPSIQPATASAFIPAEVILLLAAVATPPRTWSPRYQVYKARSMTIMMRNRTLTNQGWCWTDRPTNHLTKQLTNQLTDQLANQLKKNNQPRLPRCPTDQRNIVLCLGKGNHQRRNNLNCMIVY